ncbi:MAG: M20/M25/M40 family metallo-hydrolase [Candidatus Heimdallarchaeota archaeon]|nr:M20/M25/M40 family metallo-hydrolase [Candidatus Heimdallarchaeota archaeon]
MTNQIKEDLKVLSQVVGVSSRETRVVKAIKERIAGLADDIEEDISGNLIATLKGTQENGPVLMLDAHTDEIGLMVRHISSDGFIYFAKIGGFVDLIFPGQTVVFVPEDESKSPVYGVIGIKPPHITKESDKKPPAAEDLAIDIGASSEEEVKQLGLDVGTTGTLVGKFRELVNGRLLGKAFDDRTGCVVLIEILRRLSKDRPKGTVVFNFASAEEVGGRGATTAAYAIEPDMALAIENTTAGDTPGVSNQDCPAKLDAGPAITVADRSLIANYQMVEKLKALAEKKDIPWQYKKPLSGGTDAGRIAITRAGVPCSVVSVPCRYIHSPISLLVLKDIERTCDLVEAFTRSFHTLLK